MFPLFLLEGFHFRQQFSGFFFRDGRLFWRESILSHLGAGDLSTSFTHGVRTRDRDDVTFSDQDCQVLFHTLEVERIFSDFCQNNITYVYRYLRLTRIRISQIVMKVLFLPYSRTRLLLWVKLLSIFFWRPLIWKTTEKMLKLQPLEKDFFRLMECRIHVNYRSLGKLHKRKRLGVMVVDGNWPWGMKYSGNGELNEGRIKLWLKRNSGGCQLTMKGTDAGWWTELWIQLSVVNVRDWITWNSGWSDTHRFTVETATVVQLVHILPTTLTQAKCTRDERVHGQVHTVLPARIHGHHFRAQSR